MYISTGTWRDLSDRHLYHEGDPFPFDGREVDKARLAELESGRNQAGLKLIRAVEARQPEQRKEAPAAKAEPEQGGKTPTAKAEPEQGGKTPGTKADAAQGGKTPGAKAKPQEKPAKGEEPKKATRSRRK